MMPRGTPHPLEEVARVVVDCGYHLHRETGPGLLESVYETVLSTLLERNGLHVQRQVPVAIEVFGIRFDEGFRADLVVEDQLLIELKSIEALSAVHYKQVLTYLRLLRLPLGLLINFGAPTFKDGIKRIANQHHHYTTERSDAAPTASYAKLRIR